MKISEQQSALVEMADAFTSHILEHKFSTADLQGFLLQCKNSPEHAVSKIIKWVDLEQKVLVKVETRRKEGSKERRR